MTLETVIAFALFALVGSITPGPNNIMLTATGAAVGIRKGMPTLLGITLGFSLMVTLVALGLGSFITANPAILDVLRIGGALILLWMSWQIATAPISTDPASSSERSAIGFIPAAAFQWINPKAWLIAVSAVSTYFVAGWQALPQSLFFGGIFLLSAVPACFLWLSFGAAAGRLLASRPRLARGFNWLMAALLIASIGLIFTA